MAVVTYQCSTCKRQINLVQNKQGLDHIGNCNITLGCRGQLMQKEVHEDFIRGSLSPDVVGLKNWVQRQVLFNFVQSVDRQNWVIVHNLGTQPSVQILVNVPISGNETNQVEILPTEIIYNSDDQLTLVLPKAYSGTAQLIARASNPDILNPRPRPVPVTVVPTLQITNAGTLTIATRASTTGTAVTIAVNLEYTSSAGPVIDVGYIATNVPSDLSPWADITRIMFKGKVYLVRTLNIQTVSGQVTNGSAVALTTINPSGQVTINVASVNNVTNAFVVSGDYSLYFTTGSNFTIQGTHTINDRIWEVAASNYDPVTQLTAIMPTDTIQNAFPLPAQIVQGGSRATTDDEVIILLGTSPFTIYDKITGSYIDFNFLGDEPAATSFNLFFNAGDMFANTSIEETIYPPIRGV